MLLGLTGGYCAGKNRVAEMLTERGFLCFDIDKLGHEALGQADVVQALADRFGTGILDASGALNRKALGAILFADPAALAWEEALVHPAVGRIFKPRLERALAEGQDVCINAALLYRMPTEMARCDAIIEVHAPLPVRIRRGTARDGLAPDAIRDRVLRQEPFWEHRKDYAGLLISIDNDADETALAQKIDAALAQIRIGVPKESR
jgi:dephospho-CoA kinase